MPVKNAWEYTEPAIADCLAQTGIEPAPRLLVVNNGSTPEVREALEHRAEREGDRLLVWHHDPPLPSLSSTWNAALDFVWRAGGEEALVVNNDVRLDPWTYATLRAGLLTSQALFVSAIGWDARRWMDTMFTDREAARDSDMLQQRGGPDFSCFLIARACHEAFRFDEAIIPAYTEDLDMHRRLLLAGEGQRIFSVNLPYLHYGSRTVNSLSPEEQERFAQQVGQARAYYARKWGGPENHETFFSPFDQGVEGISTAGMPNPPTTPALQAWAQAGAAADAPAG